MGGGADLLKEIRRREFLKRVVATGAGAYGLGRFTRRGSAQQAAPAKGRSRVVIVRSSALGPFEGRPQPDQSLLSDMLARGVKALTGESSAMKAWAKVIKPDDRVSIKVNGLGGPRCSSRPELANAIAAGAQAAGVAADSIIVWDRRDRDLDSVGFAINRDAAGVKCYGTEGDYTDEMEHRSFRGRISRILADRTTAADQPAYSQGSRRRGRDCRVEESLRNLQQSRRAPRQSLRPIPGGPQRPAAHPRANPAGRVRCDSGRVRGRAGIRIARLSVGLQGYHAELRSGGRRLHRLGTDRPTAKGDRLPSLAEAGREPKWIATAETLGLAPPTRTGSNSSRSRSDPHIGVSVGIGNASGQSHDRGPFGRWYATTRARHIRWPIRSEDGIS